MRGACSLIFTHKKMFHKIFEKFNNNADMTCCRAGASTMWPEVEGYYLHWRLIIYTGYVAIFSVTDKK